MTMLKNKEPRFSPKRSAEPHEGLTMKEWRRNIILLIVFALVLGVGLMSIPYDGSNILILYVLIASVAVVAVVGHICFLDKYQTTFRRKSAVLSIAGPV